MSYLFRVVCPKCNKESEVGGDDRWKNPRVNCGDCLFDAVEVVEMKVVSVVEQVASE